MKRGLLGVLGGCNTWVGVYMGLVASGALVGCGEGASAGAERPEPGSEPAGDDGQGSPGDEGLAPALGFLAAPPRESVAVALPVPELGALREELSAAYGTSAAELQARHAVQHLEALSYDPGSAAGLDLISISPLGLNVAERQVLAERGFVISPRVEYPTFTYGYATIYSSDLPVFISADMILDAVHRSFDLILAQLELSVLQPQLEQMLRSMRARLAAGDVALDPAVAADVDVFLSVALSLLLDDLQQPARRELNDEVESAFGMALAAAGAVDVELFGVPRTVDASQFQPRGHYAEDSRLAAYFRAMMWLGRIDFRLIETQEDGSQVYHPRQLQAALALDALLDDGARVQWENIDRAVGLFVGEHDDMTLLELPRLLAALGASDAAALASLPDARVAETIAREGFGEQRIASRILVRRAGDGTFPLDQSFALFGQRYTVDSHVFSNVVYDRVGGGDVPRVVPSPLDVAFAALNNDQALGLLSGELSRFAYAGDLAGMRRLVDAHAASYWQSSLYTSWLAALRTLSPNAGGTPLDQPGLPEVARTDAWGRRVLNTQLASWAQLRHDTVLYAKPSYTLSDTCEFPDAYVDPYPEFFRALERFAELGRSTILALDPSDGTAHIERYFLTLGEVSGRLADMAEYQRTGEPHTQEQLDFINDAIQIETGCGGGEATAGWYKQLFFAADDLVFDPTIADVHTDPGGLTPPRGPSVLHVGTGNARLIVMTRETCSGPRAYAGMVSSYHELLEPGLTRLDDSAWAARITAGEAPGPVPWLANALPPSAP